MGVWAGVDGALRLDGYRGVSRVEAWLEEAGREIRVACVRHPARVECALVDHLLWDERVGNRVWGDCVVVVRDCGDDPRLLPD